MGPAFPTGPGKTSAFAFILGRSSPMKATATTCAWPAPEVSGLGTVPPPWPGAAGRVWGCLQGSAQGVWPAFGTRCFWWHPCQERLRRWETVLAPSSPSLSWSLGGGTRPRAHDWKHRGGLVLFLSEENREEPWWRAGEAHVWLCLLPFPFPLFRRTQSSAPCTSLQYFRSRPAAR